MDAADFDDFYAGSFGRLVHQLHAMIGNRDEAEECVQETFVRAWSHRHRLDSAYAPEAWVRTTAYRLAVSRWRQTFRGRRAPDRALQPAGHAPKPTEDQISVIAALRQLPEAQRRALVLHHLCDLPVRAVATETGVAEGTVKARLARGRAALAVLLEDTSPDIAPTRSTGGPSNV